MDLTRIGGRTCLLHSESKRAFWCRGSKGDLPTSETGDDYLCNPIKLLLNSLFTTNTVLDSLVVIYT